MYYFFIADKMALRAIGDPCSSAIGSGVTKYHSFKKQENVLERRNEVGMKRHCRLCLITEYERAICLFIVKL